MPTTGIRSSHLYRSAARSISSRVLSLLSDLQASSCPNRERSSLTSCLQSFLEQFGAMRIGPDFGDGIQTFVAFRPAVTGIAAGFEKRLALLCKRFIDGEWITRRRNFFRQIGLPFHHGEIEFAMFAMSSLDPVGCAGVRGDPSPKNMNVAATAVRM